MAERVPIWYDVHGSRNLLAETYSTLQTIAAQLHRDLSVSIAVAVASNERDGIECVASSGALAPPVGTRVSSEHGICAACVRQNRLQLSNDTLSDPMLSRELCARLGIRSILAVPLRRHLMSIGFIAAFSDLPHPFDLRLTTQIRAEAATIERLLAGNSCAERASACDNSRHSDFRFDRETLGIESHADAGIASEYQLRYASAFAAYARLASIAVLVCCGIAFFALPPRVVRFQTSPAHYPMAEGARAQALLRTEAPIPVKGIKNDDSELRDLHRRSNAGDVTAQSSLAARYEKGDGLGRDPLKACVWSIIAGANGDMAAKNRAVRLSHRLPRFQIAEIRFNVGKMYMQGTGVRRDLVAAYSWFSLAQAAGDVRAHDEQQKLEALMSREQVSAGLRRASDWLLAHQSGAGRHTRELAAISRNTHLGIEKSR